MATQGAMKGVSLLKRGWHHIPEIMCCLGLLGISTAAVGVACFTYEPEKRHLYKFNYFVVRDTELKENWLKAGVYNQEDIESVS